MASSKKGTVASRDRVVNGGKATKKSSHLDYERLGSIATTPSNVLSKASKKTSGRVQHETLTEQEKKARKQAMQRARTELAEFLFEDWVQPTLQRLGVDLRYVEPIRSDLASHLVCGLLWNIHLSTPYYKKYKGPCSIRRPAAALPGVYCKYPGRRVTHINRVTAPGRQDIYFIIGTWIGGSRIILSLMGVNDHKWPSYHLVAHKLYRNGDRICGVGLWFNESFMTQAPVNWDVGKTPVSGGHDPNPRLDQSSSDDPDEDEDESEWLPSGG